MVESSSTKRDGLQALYGKGVVDYSDKSPSTCLCLDSIVLDVVVTDDATRVLFGKPLMISLAGFAKNATVTPSSGGDAVTFKLHLCVNVSYISESSASTNK